MIDNLPRPHFLYIGGINQKIWPEILEALGRSFPGGSIVLMGPKTNDVIIPDLPNIHMLPAREHYAELAPFLAKADAGIIPYHNDHYSGVMHPAKLNEYLIFGLPVVATATPELEKLSLEWGNGFLYLGTDPEDFTHAAIKSTSRR
jgi:glycosyltransferase involved in cell wall biosynthesis